MSVIEKTKEELQDVEVLRDIASALLEISSIKIRLLREDFETNRIFFEEVSDLYRLVKLSAQVRGSQVDSEQTQAHEIHVAITSNKRFHGSLNRTVMDVFQSNITDNTRDYLVVGHTGKYYLEDTEYQKTCNYLSFKDDYPTPTETDVFLERMRPYTRVILYYPRFINIFTLTPSMIDITHTAPIGNKETSESDIHEIYEPELPHILAFFETQIRKLLFMRIMLESELSRTAARLIKMNSTQDRAEEVVGEKRLILRKEITAVEDIRLLETFSSAMQWKKL